MMENPYDVTTTDSVYVGNRDLRRDLIRRLTRGRQSFAIIGGRRCGKTSTLKQIQADLTQDPSVDRVYFPLYLGPGSFDEASPGVRYSSASIWRKIYDLLVEAIPGIPIDAIRDESPYRSFLNAVGKAESKFADQYQGREWVSIIMIDEIDAIKKGLDSRTMFFGNLRDLMSASDYRSRFRLVVTGVNDLSGLTTVGSPLSGILATKELGIVDDDSVEELIRIGFGDDLPAHSISCLKDLIGGHPYLLQGILHELYHRRKTVDMTMDPNLVMEASRGFERHYRQTFHIWQEALGERSCAVFGYLSTTGRTVSRVELGDALGYEGRTIDDALTRLSTHGVIDDSSEREPRICGSMFRTWFERQVAIPTVKSVLDRVHRMLDEVELDQATKDAVRGHFNTALEAMEEDGPAKKAARFVGRGCQILRGFKDTLEGAEKIVEIAAEAFPFLSLVAKDIGL